ncbi:TPA: peptidase M3 [Candidatus Sumerlaeota bacterium]|jgi:peptidyl-dipeptidase A|nr:peptidase M3 [Candidatus Sumerlaeota bacterium]
MSDVRSFIAARTAELEPLYRDCGLACWDANITGKPEDFDRMATLQKQTLDIFSNTENFEKVKAFRADPALKSDPLLARQIELLYNWYRGAQGDQELLKRIVDLESEVVREFNVYRADYDGEKRGNNYLEEILKTTRNSDEAKATWEALKQVGPIAAPRIVELVKLRNQHARNLGCSNFYQLSLELNEIDQDWLFDLLGQLEKQSDPLFREMRTELDARLADEFSIAVADLRPWHYRNAFFQEMPPDDSVDLTPTFRDQDLAEITEAYYDSIGLDISEMVEASDLYEKEGKDQHAFCIGIEIPSDVRVLANVKPGEYWASTMLHEFGHAVYYAYVDPELPFFLRNVPHTMTTEAVAMMNERFLSDAGFLEKIAGMDAVRAKEVETARRKYESRKYLVFLRWVLVMTHFERAMYENPDQDLNQLWWKTVERFQWLNGAERHAYPDWASKLHLVSAPVYYHSYLLGEMTASQLLAALRTNVDVEKEGCIGNTKVGAFFVNSLFRHGATKHWNDQMTETTGEPLNPRFFLSDLGA